jgi:hypothetical protein
MYLSEHRLCTLPSAHAPVHPGAPAHPQRRAQLCRALYCCSWRPDTCLAPAQGVSVTMTEGTPLDRLVKARHKSGICGSMPHLRRLPHVIFSAGAAHLNILLWEQQVTVLACRALQSGGSRVHWVNYLSRAVRSAPLCRCDRHTHGLG